MSRIFCRLFHLPPSAAISFHLYVARGGFTFDYAMIRVAGLVFCLGLGATYIFDYLATDPDIEMPHLPDTYWGPEGAQKNDKSVRPFTIDVSDEVIEDLKNRLEVRRKFVEPLENTGWNYGLSGAYMENVILPYWRQKYDWKKRQTLLNKYPQFVTNIQGLDIHFYRVRPGKDIGNKKVLPLLLVHGWPGSVVEFQKLLPILTAPRADSPFVFEVIAPSLPGYGFSQGAARPGLGPAQMGVVFKNLMSRLGFEKFYTQGGDWGAIITTSMAALFPDRILGMHANMCHIQNGKSMLYTLAGSLYPSWIIPEDEHRSRLYPLKNVFSYVLRESGYMHLQATKPDTVGNALSESPVALANYILEKFSTWTNPEYVSRDDGGLLEKFTLDELLDNIMIYWVTDSITTSMRLYAEAFAPEYRSQKFDEMLVKVPSGCASFPNELLYAPEKLLKFRYKNLTQMTHPSRGGHFAAFEEPKILADDLWSFVSKVE